MIEELANGNAAFVDVKVKELDDNQLKDLIDQGIVKTIIIPPIESVNYGRTVGYDIIEHIPPQDIKEISATKIRNKQK